MARTTRNPEARTPIVEAAWRLVAAEGVHGATMRRIAAEAGVTTGSVTHYYDDKQALLADVVRHNNLRSRDRVLAAIGGHRGLVALEAAVEAMLPLDAGRRREWRVGVACWGPTAPGERAAEELRGGWRALQRLLATLLEQAVEDGDLPGTVEVRYEAGRLVTLIAGVGMLAGIESPQRIRRDAKRMLADQLAGLERGRPDKEAMDR
ncbi:MAG TPA: TetR/AcrR family transcriptional regulator [Baekduia sp.]|nr:TetR/AcrR family transcriptional regulator [Baekduia sp.]